MAKRLLVADGSPTIQRVVEVIFEGKDIEVVAAYDGATALRLARERKPDVVLASLDMPPPDGLSLCREMKSDPALRAVPCVLLTNAFGEFDETSARAAGAASWLAKPFEAEELVAQVEVALGEREQGATAPPPAPSPLGAASVEPAVEDFLQEEGERAGGAPRAALLAREERGGVLDTGSLLDEAERLIREDEEEHSVPSPASAEVLGGSEGELERLGLDPTLVAASPAGAPPPRAEELGPEAMGLADLLEAELAPGGEKEEPPADEAVSAAGRPEPPAEEGGEGPPAAAAETPVAAPHPPPGGIALDLPEAELRSLVREALSQSFERVVPRVVRLVEEAAREMAPAIVERVVREEIEKLKRGE